LPAIAWCILFSANSVFVQQGPEELIRNYKISFPIVELGNCANYTECRFYCEDPLNQNACATYAKEKGFYKAPEAENKKAIILDAAREELGCATHRLCNTFCEQKENIEKCNSFAQRHKLYGGYQANIEQGKVLEKARDALGCNSQENCKTYCEQDVNKEACTNFARIIGIRGGIETKGPGSCTSEITCKTYCSNPNNFDECAKFTSSYKLSEFRGAGGCESVESCKAYCDINPSKCYGYGTGPYVPPDPISACSKIAGCSWLGNTCQCATVQSAYDPKDSCEKISGCSWNNNSCDCSKQSDQDKAQECINHGCSWNSAQLSCQCEATQNFCQPPSSGCGTNYYWDYNSCVCKLSSTTCQGPSSGCGTNYFWDSSSCSCKSSTSECHEPSSGCGTNYYWDSSSCSCRPKPTTSPTSTTTSCQEPSSGCGGGYYWDSGACSCKPNPTSSSCQPPSSGCESGKYWDYSKCSCRTPEEMCKDTSGCSWTGSTCQCSQGESTSLDLTPEIAKEHNISFPIPELGNCNNCGECNDFCLNPINREKCIAFSKKTGLYDEEEREQALIYEKSKTELGCDSEKSCKIYCQKEENFDKCKIFAAKHDIIDDPAILNLTPGKIVSKTQSISFKAPKSATMDIMLQPIDSVSDTIYVGRTRLMGNITTGDFSWDSTNTPNGEYNLIATVIDSNGEQTTVGPIRVTVENPFPPGFPEVTTKDIALASQFKPDEVAVDNNTVINKIENKKTETNQMGVVLEGKASANTIVTVIIYSNPIIVTVKTDANGLWKYSLEKPLNSGEHIAYVVTSRTDGTKVRSEASTFFVPPAFAANLNENSNIESASESGSLWIFVYATIAIIIVSIALLLIIYKIKSRSPL